MKIDDIRKIRPKVLTPEQREFYYENGYLFAEKLIPSEWVRRLRAALAEMVEQSRSLANSNEEFVLDPAHTSDVPRLRRLNRATDNHPTFWDFAKNSVLPDAVADLVGPNVKFRELNVNFKWAHGGDEVKWHQDSGQGYTNKGPLVALVCLEDVDMEQGPLMVVPGSHKGEIYKRYDENNRWMIALSDEDLKRAPIDKAVSLTGPAGSVSFHHMHTLHASKRNDSPRGRPLLQCGYDPADAFSVRPLAIRSKYAGEIVRGYEPQYAHLEEGMIPLPPDWSKQRYTSIYEVQQKEDRQDSRYYTTKAG
jgi:ectoine hydroxylase-related dioxygenase (phytanoyl-CoA dioxygenase family)